MNYSCKSDSIWQTFRSHDCDMVHKKNQIFEIDDLETIKFTFEELNESIEDCLDKVKLHFSLEKEQTIFTNFYVDRFGHLCYLEKTIRRRPAKISKSELLELRGYMERFLLDIENDGSLV